MSHITYLLDCKNKDNSLTADIVKFLREGKENRLIRIFYIKPLSYNRSYILVLKTLGSEYLGIEISTYLNGQNVIVHSTKPGYHLSDNFFLPENNKSSAKKFYNEAINNLKYIEFFKYNKGKYVPEIQPNIKLLQTQPNDFFVDNSIDYTNPHELMSMIQTLANETDKNKSKKISLKIADILGI